MATFWQLLEEFGLPYILTLGHSVCLFHSQRSAVQIQSSEKFIYWTFVYCQLYWKDENKYQRGQKKENQTCPGEILTQDIQVTRWGGRPLRPSRSRRSLTCCSQTSPFETFIPKRLTLIVCGLQLLSCLPLWDIHRFLNEKKHLKRKYYKWLARDVCSGVTNIVTRLGNLLDFGQLFKAVGNNWFAQISPHS